MSNIIISPQSGVIEFNTGIAGCDNSFHTSTAPIRLDATGGDIWFTGSNVGIGTTNPSHLLHVYAADGVAVDSYISLIQNAEATAGDNFGLKVQAGRNSSDVTMEVSNAVGTSYMRVRGDGNVGIGTTSPQTKLHVNGSIGAYTSDYAAGSTGSRLLMKTFATTGNTYSFIQAQDVGGNSNNVLALQPYGDNVGIGTTSPATKLSVSGGDISAYTSNGTSRIFVSENGTTGFNGLVMQCNGGANNTDFYTNGTSNGMWISAIGGNSDIGLSANKDIYLKTDNGGSLKGGTTQVTVKQGGNVGIGTTNPNDQDLSINDPKLHVVGPSTTGAFNLVARFQGGNDNDNTGAAILINHSNDRGLLINAGRADSDREVAYFNLVSSGAVVTNMLTLRKVGSAYNVGIGTTSPSTKLHINAGSTNTVAIFESTDATSRIALKDNSGEVQIAGIGDNLTFNTSSSISERMRITSSGNVGIGTNSPSANLHIQGSSATDVPIIRVGGFGNSGSTLELAETLSNGDMTYGFSFFNDGNSSNTLQLKRHSNSSAGATIVTFNRTDNNVSFSGGLTIALKATSSSTLSTDGGTTLATKNYVDAQVGSADTLQEVTDNGNTTTNSVGIGTTSPDQKLQVIGDVSVGKYDGTDFDRRIGINSSNGAYANGSSYIRFQELSASGTTNTTKGCNIRFYNHLYAGNTNETLVIQANGNVGIGITSPEVKLHVGTATLGVAPDTNADIFSSGGVTLETSKRLSFDADYYIHGNIRYIGSGTAEAKLEYQGYYGHNFIRRSGTSAMVIKGDTGNVGIGTTSPSQKLEVNGAVLAGDYRGSSNIYLSSPDSWIFRSTGGTERMRLTSSGNVGIGTTSPSGQLHVKGSTNRTIKIDSTLADGTGSFTTLAFARNGNDKWRIWQFGDDRALSFYNDIIGSHQLTLKSDGNVGIGTTSPSAKLDVSVTSGAAWMNLINGSETNFRLTTYNNGTSNGSNAYAFKHGLYYSTTENAAVTFYRGGSSTGGFLTFTTNAGNERMRIDPNGNVGIGTTSPSANLDVVGSSKFRGTVNHSWFNYSTGEDTYIRGGKSTSKVYINDSNAADVVIASGGGNVGIGTTSPSDFGFLETAVEISAGSSSSTTLQQAGLVLSGSSDADDADDFAYLAFTNHQSTLSNGRVAEIRALKNGTNVDTGELAFYTILQERMRIDTSGNVGIGTTNPNVKLHVEGDPNAAGVLGRFYGSATHGALLQFHRGASYNWLAGIGGNSASAGVPASYFGIVESGNSPRLVIAHTTGNVGIGTITPDKKLQISESNTSTSDTSGLKITNASVTSNTNAGILFENYDNNGAWIRSIRTGTSNGKLSFGTNSGAGIAESNISERMVIDHNGNVGIGTASPVAKLQIQSVSTSTDSNTLRITHSRSDANVPTHAAFIDMNLSGADTTTADRINSALFIDIDSSANGDASNEHRIYGVHSDLKFSGFTDIARAGHFYAESNYTGAKTAQLVGVYGNAVHDANSTSGGVSNMYGVFGVSSIQDLGDVDNAFGGYFYVAIGTGRGNANVGVTKGVQGEIQIDKDAAIDYGTMIGVSSIIDNNEGSTPNFGDQYLFKGDYQGTKGSNAYGIYVEGDKNYFVGNVGIGIENPSRKLHIVQTSTTEAGVYVYSNAIHTGTGTQSLVSIRQDHASSTGTVLDVRGDGTGDKLIVWDNASVSLIVKDGGNVGIGTASPSGNGSKTTLHINSDTNGSAIRLSQAGNSALIRYDDTDGLQVGTIANKKLSFETGDTTAITIDTSQNVGIGTTSPAQKLVVATDQGTTFSDAFLALKADTVTDNVGRTAISLATSPVNNYGVTLNGIRHGSSSGEPRFGINMHNNSAGGVEALSIRASGNVGIGTTSPSKTLEVNGTLKTASDITCDGTTIFGGTSSLNINLFAAGSLNLKTNNTTALTINSSQKVGIGTTSPTSKLHIDDSATAGTGLLVTGGGQGGPLAKFTRDVGSTGTITISSSGGDPQINFASSANTFALGTNGSIFEICDSGALGTNSRLSIISSGNVGIGTTSPTEKLHVAGNIELQSAWEIGSNDGSYWQRIRTEDSSVSTTNAFNFETRNGSGSFIKHMVIRNDGNVGIGVTNPSYALQVGGSIVGTSKNFIIDHPTKEGKKLLHACIEGPEAAVYFRGKSTSNIIEMPDYWIGLVDIDTMTVDITPWGPNQDIYVESIADDGEITIAANTEEPLNYFYVVYGERKDIGKLDIEVIDAEYSDESTD